MDEQYESTNPQGITYKVDKLRSGEHGCSGEPVIGFDEDPSTGWYLNCKGEVVFTSKGEDSILHTQKYTKFIKPLAIADSTQTITKLNNRGVLYKKPGDYGLWWKTENGEVNLINSNQTSIKGLNNALQLSENSIKSYKPFEFQDSYVRDIPETPLTGMLYKKAGTDRLYWKTQNREIDITRDLPDVLEQYAYSFKDDPDSHLSMISKGHMTLIVNNKSKLDVKNAEIVAKVPVRLPSGSHSMPSLTFSNVKSGFYEKSDDLCYVANGVRTVDFTKEGILSHVNLKTPSVSSTYLESKITLDKNITLETQNTKVQIDEKGLNVNSLNTGKINLKDYQLNADSKFQICYKDLELLSVDPTGLKTRVLQTDKIQLTNGIQLVSNKLQYQECTIQITSDGIICNKPITMLNGSLSDRTDGLYWIDADNKETNLLTRGMLELPASLKLANGNQNAPTYSFAEATNTGMTFYQNKLSIVYAGIEYITMDTRSINMQNTVKIKDISLEAKEDGLWITHKGVSKNLLAKPEQIAEVKLTDIDVQTIKLNGAELHYDSTKDLLSINGQELNTKLERFHARPTRDLKNLEFSFINNLDTGMTCLERNVLALSAGGNPNLIVAEDQVIIGKPLTIQDSVSNVPTIHTEGRLYKKPNDNSLYWQTKTSEHNITQMEFPIRADSGTYLSPSYGFKEEDGTGMHKLNELGLGLSVIGKLAVAIDRNVISVYKDIILHSHQSEGRLSTQNGMLYWNDKNLCVEEYPKLASRQENPAYSFVDNPESGLNYTDELQLVADGVVSASFDINGVRTHSIKTSKISLDSCEMFVENNKLVCYVNGDKTVISEKIQEFQGGVLENPLTIPKLNIGNYSLSTLNDKLDFQCNGRSIVRIDEGLHASMLNINGVVFENLIDKFVISANETPVLQIVNDTVKLDKLQLDNGRLSSRNNKLYWTANNVEMQISDEIKYPLTAPNNNEIAYGFKDSNVGIAKVNEKLVLATEHAEVIIHDEGVLEVPGIAINTIHTSQLEIQLQESKVIITDDKIQSAGVFRSANDKLVFGYDLEDKQVGLGTNGQALTLESGNQQPVCISDVEMQISDRKLTFTNASLTQKGSELYWQTEDKEVLLSKQPEHYQVELSYVAGSDVQKGDAVCIVDNKVCKAIGGHISKLDYNGFTDMYKSMNVFSYESDYILAYTRTKQVAAEYIVYLTILQMADNIVKRKYEMLVERFETSVEVYSKIIQTAPDDYIVAVMQSNTNEIKLHKLTNVFNSAVKQTNVVNLPANCINMTCEYDMVENLVIVCYSSELQNFLVCIVKNNLEIGLIESEISNMAVVDIDKQIHLLLIPGGTCMISYGIVKIVFIFGFTSITTGEAFMDYESIDCAGLLYDHNYGIIMTLEKTVSGSCFIQILDVLGITIQKLSSKGFNNANMEPLGISYNNTTDSYGLLYAVSKMDAAVYMQNFDFVGESIRLGLRYLDSTSYSLNELVKKENNLFEIPHSNKFIYGYNSHLAVYQINYQGNPYAFIGLATQDTPAGLLCKVLIKGHIYYNDVALPSKWVGKKVYLLDPNKSYPECFTTSRYNSVFIGTCLDVNRILLGL